MTMNRRSALKLFAGAGAGGLLLPKGAFAQQPKFAGRQITYASWGGQFQADQKTSYCDPFEAKTGAKVLQDGPINNTRIRVMLDAKGPDWDVVVSDDYMIESLDRPNLLAQVDTSIVDVNKIHPEFRFDYAPSCIVGSIVLAYSTTVFDGQKRPQKWEDLFDLKGFAGKRMLFNTPSRNLELALLADGVPRDKLYPLDLDRAFKKLDTIKNQTIFYENYAQSQQLITDGAVSCGTTYSNRAYLLAKAGGKIAVSWNDNLRNVSLHVVPKFSKNLDMAWSLVKETLEPENQAKNSALQASAPTNLDALKLISPDLLPWLSTSKDNLEKGIAVDPKYWGKNLADVTKRWQAWMLT